MDLICCMFLVMSYMGLTKATQEISDFQNEVKRSSPVAAIEIIPAENFLDDANRFEKRGSSLMRYGKRPAVFRYGKRSPYDEEESFDDGNSEMDNLDKRVFRYGKRSDMDDNEVNKLYRLVLIYSSHVADEQSGEDDSKRRVFRYGKRNSYPTNQRNILADKRVFRYGKRDGKAIRGADDRNSLIHHPYRYGEE